jgi:hypothetical protein
MKRRALLGSLLSLATGASAGCLSERWSGAAENRANEMPDGNETDEPARSSTPSPDDSLSPIGGGFRWEPAGDAPARQFSVGERSVVAFPDANRPHRAEVLNDSEESRAFSLRITSSAGSLARSVSLPPRRRVAVVLAVPATYRLAVAVGEEPPTRVRIPRDSFDCSDSTTRVAVRADGRVEWATDSASGSCRPPAVVDRSLTVEGRTCGDDTSDASVSFSDQRVVVRGTIPVAGPCGTARLRTVRYDRPTGTLAVVVTDALATEQSACADCADAVAYHAAVGFERGYPDRVVVGHAVGGERTTVATTGRR